MKIRRITSLILLFSLTLCILTSVILFITPHGRVAYWSNWTLWGLSKSQWSELHVNLGILFLLAGLLHTCYNWKAITGYLKNQAREIKIFTPEFNLALLLVLFVFLGTWLRMPPLSTVNNFAESIKEAAGIKYGEPPYGHAELSSLKMFTHKVDLDLAKSIRLLRQAGLSLEGPNQTIREIARRNHLTPKQVYEIIKPASLIDANNRQPTFPDTPFPGFGRKTITELCQTYGLDARKIITILAHQNIQAKANQTVREIAKQNKTDPMALFEQLRNAAR